MKHSLDARTALISAFSHENIGNFRGENSHNCCIERAQEKHIEKLQRKLKREKYFFRKFVQRVNAYISNIAPLSIAITPLRWDRSLPHATLEMPAFALHQAPFPLKRLKDL